MADSPEKAKYGFTRRRFLTTATVGAGLALYSGEIARHELETVSKTIGIAELPDPFLGMRIVQISDIHFDQWTEPFFLKRVVREVNALKPDLVLLTGDYVSMGLQVRPIHEAASHCAEILSTIECSERYAVLGNHDRETDAPYITAALQSAGLTVLSNRHLPLERKGERIWLAGTDDAAQGFAALDLALPNDPKAPVLLMVHEPDYADSVVAHPKGRYVDLMLSGHTHGGQVRLPFLPPLTLPDMGKKYVEGVFRLGSMQLYVNRGIGAVGLPFRLNCPPEITLFTLQRA